MASNKDYLQGARKSLYNRIVKLYLLRHGECGKRSARNPDPPLTDEGIGQSEKMSKGFLKADIAAIYYSPHLRARQTAEIIFKDINRHGLEIQSSELIREKQDPDWFNAENRRDLPWDIIKKERLNPDWKLDGGESFREMNGRILSALELMIRNHGTNRNILWVTHNSVIKFILASVILGDKKELTDLFYSAFDRIEIKRGGYYAIEYKKKYYEPYPDWYLVNGNI